MIRQKATIFAVGAAIIGMAVLGCRNNMPHYCTWPATGDIIPTHPEPPEGGYYTNWDPFAVELVVTPIEDVNPVRTQHVLIATVNDAEGEPLPNRRIEWMIAEGSVGDIVEVDESGFRASRGYKVDNHYAISHTNNSDHVLDLGDDDPSNDIHLARGQSWCVITSPIEGDTHVTVYAPGIYDWSKHKVFVIKHWYDVEWFFPDPATNPIGTQHEFVTEVKQASDGSPLEGYIVTYTILDGPAGTFTQSGGATAAVQTDAAGLARVTLAQTAPMEGTNNIEVDILRPGDEQCCIPPVHIATGATSKTWIGPEITCDKSGPATVTVGDEFTYTVVVSNPSNVDATGIVVTDNIPAGLTLVSANPAGSGSWSLGTIPPNGSATVSLTVRADQTGTFENCASVSGDYGLSARCCATTSATAPALEIEKTCTAEILVCDEIEYEVVVRNTGDGPATNVRMTDQLPDGVALTDGQTTVSADLGTLEAGEAKRVRYTAKANRTGSFTNSATAVADGGLEASDSCTTVVRQPALDVTKTGPDVRYIGRTVEYQITVTNTGDGDARDTILTDNIPSGTNFVSASDGGQVSGGNVTWSLGTLAPGASRSVAMTVKPTARGTIRNTATARAYCAEGSGEATTQIKGIAAILLEVIDIEDPIEIGTQTTYVITVTNQGSADDSNIVIECILPPQQAYVSSDGMVVATVDGQRVLYAPVATLAPGAKFTHRVTIKGVSAADSRFKVIMTSNNLTSPVEETESTHIYE